MTIILTKPVRVGGVELAAATTQTFAADVEADLISRGAATPVFLAPGEVAPGANHISEHRQLGGVANQIAAIGTPFVILPGDGAAVGMFFTGTAGAFTLSAAIMANAWNALKGCWCYLPANFGGKTYPLAGIGLYFPAIPQAFYTQILMHQVVPIRPVSPTPFPVNLTRMADANHVGNYRANGALTLLVGWINGSERVINSHISDNGKRNYKHKTFKEYLDSTLGVALRQPPRLRMRY
jgi:hypothetical protein